MASIRPVWRLESKSRAHHLGQSGFLLLARAQQSRVLAPPI